jgi:uncharacterized protein (TIGR02687 family)
MQQTLNKLFQQHRIVFWYGKEEMLEEYNSLEFDGVTKLLLDNNEFSVKYRIMREQPDQKFLLYFMQDPPAHAENWLLDVQLANFEFHTDRAAIIIQDLEIDFDYKTVISQYLPFFQNKKRQDRLKAVIAGEPLSPGLLRFKMIAVTLKSNDATMEQLLFQLLEELCSNKEEKITDLNKYNLSDYFWQEIRDKFNYQSEAPTVYDFLIEIFKTDLDQVLKNNIRLNNEALIFLHKWKDSTRFNNCLNILSARAAQDLNLEGLFSTVDFMELMEKDSFQLIDQKIISSLARNLLDKTIALNDLEQIIKKRENTYWFGDFKNHYYAISFASKLIAQVNQTRFDFESVSQGFELYARQYYKIDQCYRKFLFHYTETNQSQSLGAIAETVEKIYSNTYLLKLNDYWQQFVDRGDLLNEYPFARQRNFYTRYVAPYVEKGNRIFVIISDALRYESGAELLDLLLQEDRFEAGIEPMIAGLPSYTQMGMAALLPNQTLTYDESNEYVYVDGQPSAGTASRDKILKQKLNNKALAIQASDFMEIGKKRDEGRDFTKQFDVLYIYHNRIDKLGDDKMTEEKVIGATEEEFTYLIRLLKTIANMNGNNVIITADHGYIYQNLKLEESDFSEVNRTGDIYKDSRRFIIGKNLKEQASARKFTAKELQLDDQTEFLLARSINRFRVQGAGSRFVHGGASLQELVIPVIEFSKKREKTVEKVGVDIIRSVSRITSNNAVVTFYQEEELGEGVLSRDLRVAFYAKDGSLLSNALNMTFDSRESYASSREQRARFLFSKDLGQYNHQDIHLRLEEAIEGTTKYRTYKEKTYPVLISFTNDF